MISRVGSIAAAAWIVWLVVSPSPVAWAQLFPTQFELSGSVYLEEADSSARAHLERVKAYVADQQWDEAVETLRQVMETYGGKVIPLAERRYVTVADYCQIQVGCLPEPALTLYRQRVDPQAQRWFEEGTAQRDRGRLLNVVNQLLCSSAGDKALLALGEIALEQGQYGVARGYWERIIERPPDKISAPGSRMSERCRSRPADLELLNKWYVRDTADPPDYRLKRDEYLGDEAAAALVRFWKSTGLTPTRLAYPGTTLPLADVRATGAGVDHGRSPRSSQVRTGSLHAFASRCARQPGRAQSHLHDGAAIAARGGREMALPEAAGRLADLCRLARPQPNRACATSTPARLPGNRSTWVRRWRPTSPIRARSARAAWPKTRKPC